MKPQDILVILKIHFWPYGKWTVREIADSIFISKSEVSYAINRMKVSKLYNPVTNRVNIKNLEEFLYYGLSYAFPAVLDKIVKAFLLHILLRL